MTTKQTLDGSNYEAVMSQAELICSGQEVEAAYARMAAELDRRFVDSVPVIVPVMLGGMVPAAGLMRYLTIAHHLDYIHATRYGDKTRGAALEWKVPPGKSLHGRSVIVVDDILDEGATLQAVTAALREAGAAEVFTVVLTEKIHDRRLPGMKADLVGLQLPDRFVFGCGLDYRGGLRHLPGIYAISDEVSV